MEIRNFVIISHIDHGKSTLADRFLEITGTVPENKMQEQFLDMMDLERERGITIKMQPVRMEYKGYILNLVDTPGHVDFSYEVSRSLAAVEGAVLLVDAVQGIQAQTLANLDLARKQNIVVIPVINKIDLPNARVLEVKKEIGDILNIPQQEILEVSAKQGINVGKVLDEIIKKIPSPKIVAENFRALIFDSEYDSFRGVVAYVRIIEGEIGKEEEIYLMAAQTRSKIKELGYFKPQLYAQDKLSTGEIGYIATGIKEPGKVKVGDTIISSKFKVQSSKSLEDIKPLEGYREPKPVVFVSVYPENADRYNLLRDSLGKLKLNDAAFSFEPEHKEIFGQGFRCGFLGSLHLEIIIERLRREFNINLIVFSPSVVYKIVDKQNNEKLIYSSADWPEASVIQRVQEPFVKLEIITFSDYLGGLMKIIDELKGEYVGTHYLSSEKIILTYYVPLREIISGFYDKLMAVTQGYASMNYEPLGYRDADLIKIEILISGKKEEAFSKIINKEKAYKEAKKFLLKLKETLPGQQFSVALQAVVNGKIIARETIRARGKDVIAPLYGGDYTRKRKLLEKQKKGKKELKEKGRVNIPAEVYLKVLR